MKSLFHNRLKEDACEEDLWTKVPFFSALAILAGLPGKAEALDKTTEVGTFLK